MAMPDPLDRFVADLPRRYPGPGGALAVLREGQVIARHAWGFANAERRIPFTPRTLFRMCSITKQFVCALMLAHCDDPGELDAAIAARLALLGAAAPRALHCAHNQSGLRDYWAVAMLHGSPAEAPFGEAEARQVIGGTRSLHFAPGTRFSYVNQNFRLLSDALEEHTGRSFAELLRGTIFERVGMGSAFLAADTRAMPDGTEGYEGSQASGFRAAVNNILWTGDAGLGASLDDMIAWERHIDATRTDSNSTYARLSAPVTFADGAAASYGFGLARGQEFGRALTGHGGGLRGWRSHRLHCAAERLSVVVMFNHQADAQAVAVELLGAALGETRARPDAGLPLPPWLGTYREPETGLALRADRADAGQLRLRYGQGPERLDLQPDGSATNGRTRLHWDGALVMTRPQDNHVARLLPADAEPRADIAGRWHCAELDAALRLEDAGGVLYGAFEGFLGRSRMELLEPMGRDLWALPCPRALDLAPPGDWTLAVRRGEDGRPEAIELGCWLARRLTYERVG
jgi:D-aminopeptidase